MAILKNFCAIKASVFFTQLICFSVINRVPSQARNSALSFIQVKKVNRLLLLSVTRFSLYY